MITAQITKFNYLMKKSKRLSPASTSLFQAILQIKNLPEARKFFRDLLSQQEIIEFSNRWKAAQMLDKKISFEKIQAATGMSPNTVARINKWRKKGMGGYKLLLKRTQK